MLPGACGSAERSAWSSGIGAPSSLWTSRALKIRLDPVRQTRGDFRPFFAAGFNKLELDRTFGEVFDWVASSWRLLTLTVISRFPSPAGAFARGGGGVRRGRRSEFIARARSIAGALLGAAKTEVRGRASLI